MAKEKKEAPKKEAPKKESKFWKITRPSFLSPVLRPKNGTSEKVLAVIKAKEGYKVEEA